MRLFFPLLPFLFLLSCEQVTTTTQLKASTVSDTTRLSSVDAHYQKYSKRTDESVSTGSVSNGSLKNGYLFPFTGSNFHYFDTTSYLSNRGFVHKKVLLSTLAAYAQLAQELPGSTFGIMECSNENGGKIAPHRTHQNGMSIDFMTPLLHHGVPSTELDFSGAPHYLMDFDNQGRYTEDTTYNIDFETMAHHLLALQKTAAENGLKIAKIIWKVELQKALFATPSGKKLKASGVYVTTKLTPLINSLHDDHYHVDFEKR